MKKHILLLSLLSIAWSSIEACTFTVLNNSPYEEIFISNNEHLATRVNRETLRKEAFMETKTKKQKKGDAANKKSKVVRISKVMKKDPRGQITGTWFDIYIPYYEHQRPSRTANTIAGKFKKAYRVAIRHCGQDNDIKYSDVARGYATDQDNRNIKAGKESRYDIVDFSKPEQAARAHELIKEHEETLNKAKQMNKKKARSALSKRRMQTSAKSRTRKTKFVDQFEGEHLENAKKMRPEDELFFEETTYIGDNPAYFEGTLP